MSRKHRLTGEVARKTTFEAVDHAPLLGKLGIELPEESLKFTLTHHSFADENGILTNDECLEFLDDAMLDMCIAEELYRHFPDRAKQNVSKMYTGVMNMYTLADLIRSTGLEEYILLDRGEKATGDMDKHSILTDTTEALLDAIYLQHDFEVAHKTMLRLFNQMIDDTPAESRSRDWKTLLQGRLAAKQLPAAEYTVHTTGLDHDLTFYADVLVDGVVKDSGTDAMEREAKIYAAYQAYTALA